MAVIAVEGFLLLEMCADSVAGLAFVYCCIYECVRSCDSLQEIVCCYEELNRRYAEGVDETLGKLKGS